MRRFGFKLWLFAAALILAGAFSVHAEDQENKRAWYIPELANVGVGIHGGWMNSQDADGGAGFGGAQLRFRLLSFLGIEVSGDVMEETFKNKTVDVSETPLNLTGMIYPFGAPFTFFPIPVAPYLSGGVTWVYFRTNFRGALATPPTNLQAATSDAETNRAQGWHAGIGVDIGITKNVTLNLEYRSLFWDLNKNIDNPTVRAGLPNISTNSYQIRSGLTFLFH